MGTTAIKNVNVFDGEKLVTGKTVVIENGLISDKTTSDNVIDGSGCTLLPGFFESHTHLYSIKNLKQSARFGITTMLDMGTPSHELVDSLKNLQGLPDVLSPYQMASGKGSIQTRFLGFPETTIMKSVEDCEPFVNKQLAYGADYIKLILEDPDVVGETALSPEIVKAIVDTAHKNGKIVFAHATAAMSFRIGINAGVDVLTHVPTDSVLPREWVEEMKAKNIISVPTLIMSKGTTKISKFLPTHKGHVSEYINAENNVSLFKEVGVTISAGTDSNQTPILPLKVHHGSSLHAEFVLMESAGMTPVEILQSATSVPAKAFGFNDRGRIEAGLRADLVLVKGDPTKDIKATKAIKTVWINGIIFKG
jgi:imidazolonepropionase-like amidohydrolase